MSGILIWSFEDGSVVTASYVPRWRSHMCTMYVFLLFGRNAQDVTRGFFSWPFRKKGRLDRVDRWIMGYSFRTFFFFCRATNFIHWQSSINIRRLNGPCLTIYQSWAAKSARCVETAWIHRKPSQDSWMDGQTIRAHLSYCLFWSDLLRLRLPECVCV